MSKQLMRFFPNRFSTGAIKFFITKNKMTNNCATCAIIFSGAVFAIWLKYDIFKNPAVYSDQRTHYWAGQIIALTTFLLTHIIFLTTVFFMKKNSRPFNSIYFGFPMILAIALIIAIFSTFFIAIGKEALDFVVTGTPSLMDFKYTVEGGITAVIPIGLALILSYLFIKISFWGLFKRLPRIKLKLIGKGANQSYSLQKLELLDPLAQIPNRKCFDIFYESAWECAKRDNQSIALIVVDIDLFNLYQNKYGREKGKKCLQFISSSINTFTNRGKDLVARFDESKFVVLLTGIEKKDLFHIAHKMHRKINNLKIKYSFSGYDTFITCSMGVSIVKPDDNKSPQRLLKSVNVALGKAKLNGGNVLRFLQAK